MSGRHALALLALLALALVGASDEPRPRADAAARLGLSLSSDEPMNITADELEASRDDVGREHIVFRRDVEVRQEDLRLSCDWLEAIYAADSGRPRHIFAKGSVRIAQHDTAVTCAEAVYDSEECTLVCMHPEANAQLRRGDDTLRGREIHFDLCKGLLKVRGGARIEVVADEDAADEAPADEASGDEAPADQEPAP